MSFEETKAEIHLLVQSCCAKVDLTQRASGQFYARASFAHAHVKVWQRSSADATAMLQAAREHMHNVAARGATVQANAARRARATTTALISC